MQEPASIEADSTVPVIHITREFAATPAQLLRAHTDPEVYARWVGPDAISTKIDYWDARTGGSWRYVASHDGAEYGFRGCFHEVSPNKIVQTFTFEAMPDGVALETLTFTDLGDGRTRLHASSDQRLTTRARGGHPAADSSGTGGTPIPFG